MGNNNVICYINKCNNFTNGEWKYSLADWKKVYGDELKNKGFGNQYKDIDREETYALPFYEKLTTFLNEREKSLEEKLNGKYIYKMNYAKPYGIEVREILDDIEVSEILDEDVKTAPLFYLKSDQLGFSAPSKNKNHIYDVYIEKKGKSEEENEEACKQVAEWIYNTRTLGGSFLWPMEYMDGEWNTNPKYNYIRGGSKSKRGGSYIEDRVDLTLYEIKQVFDYVANEKVDGNILWSCCLSEPNMMKWLKHFVTFEIYIEFFFFDSFVNKDDHMPYDITITTDKLKMALNYKDETFKNRKDNSIYDKDVKTIENILVNVSKMVIERSEKMEAFVSKKVRSNIDRIDNEIIKLIAERTEYMKQASFFKKSES